MHEHILILKFTKVIEFLGIYLRIHVYCCMQDLFKQFAREVSTALLTIAKHAKGQISTSLCYAMWEFAKFDATFNTMNIIMCLMLVNELHTFYSS